MHNFSKTIPIAMNNDQKIFWCPMPFAKITNSAQTVIINNLNAICNMDSYPSFMMMFYSNITILVSVIAIECDQQKLIFFD